MPVHNLLGRRMASITVALWVAGCLGTTAEQVLPAPPRHTAVVRSAQHPWAGTTTHLLMPLQDACARASCVLVLQGTESRWPGLFRVIENPGGGGRECRKP
jgi:hypothetical protein